MKVQILLSLINLFVVKAYSPLSPQNSPPLTSRRNIFASAVTLATSAVLLDPTIAGAAEELTKFQDEQCKFTLSLPSWERSEQQLPDRRKIVLYVKPDSDKKTLLSLVYTPVRADFTSLGSFGSVDEVAQATILPKSTLAGKDEIESKMLSAESKKQAYFFDYTQKVPGQPQTRFRTIFALANGATGGAGSVLVSITAQTQEADYETIKPLFDEIIESYK